MSLDCHKHFYNSSIFNFFFVTHPLFPSSQTTTLKLFFLSELLPARRQRVWRLEYIDPNNFWHPSALVLYDVDDAEHTRTLTCVWVQKCYNINLADCGDVHTDTESRLFTLKKILNLIHSTHTLSETGKIPENFHSQKGIRCDDVKICACEWLSTYRVNTLANFRLLSSGETCARFCGFFLKIILLTFLCEFNNFFLSLKTKIS